MGNPVVMEWVERAWPKFGSPRKFAIAADISPTTLNNVRDGIDPDPETLIKMARANKFPPLELLLMAGYLKAPEIFDADLKDDEALLVARFRRIHNGLYRQLLLDIAAIHAQTEGDSSGDRKVAEEQGSYQADEE